MMSDVPFGVFLSGGVDSSTNVALMSELMDEPVRTFSVGFERARAVQRARVRARRSRSASAPTTTRSSSTGTTRESFLPELIHHQDEPIADWVCVPLYFVSKLARDSGTIVVQVGEGVGRDLPRLPELHRRTCARIARFWEPFSACRGRFADGGRPRGGLAARAARTAA